MLRLSLLSAFLPSKK